MSNNWKLRTQIVIGEDNINKLDKASVLVFGVGGVGGFAIEGLVRAGIGNITIVDYDTVDPTNINRQIIALNSTIGEAKVDVMEKRILDINPYINIKKHKLLYDESTSDLIFSENYDYVVDAIDMVKSKILLAQECDKRGLKLISCMGMGNKLDPTMIEITDIYRTEMCPLAKVMRREMKKRYIKKLTVVYSKEKPSDTILVEENGKSQRVNGSTSFVPSSAGLAIASYIIRYLTDKL
ncbi:tRNA threonylcarbamoyladenosine dehydratase [Peptostreptococcus equinus]|uniref:tRNA threonylcarbamoyladenosine dehydratase n=1 Tax=Peptostreptococcus equinus TaxID=3003601 RepID=A0ABY7JP03_9FIRM|nr:tRNA threonylcarbamoyladenosine dehydratase [Peptostreptococcus sp. CBA3647]WAW14206.1 tRNA threonylcarbamoyladenosine dehydratase [Peptostreptococcus sp. CBA3647]